MEHELKISIATFYEALTIDLNYTNKYNSRYDGEQEVYKSRNVLPYKARDENFLPLVFHLCFELKTKNFFIFRDLRLISGPFFMQYDHLTIEAKWQNHWSKNNTFKAEIDHEKEKLYVLDMFPYPSGSGFTCWTSSWIYGNRYIL